MSAEVRVSAPAKVNLSLGVGARRPDGYHPLATVYQAVGLHDEVVVRPHDADGVAVTVSGDGVEVADVPLDGRNLAVRAAQALAAHHGVAPRVALHLHKRIPIAGGLAGGSTDAAAALVGLDALLDLHTSRADLLHLAAQLGSDVPFCLTGGTAIGSGRGEVVTPVMTRGSYWWVLVTDPEGLSTRQVYAEFDRLTAADEVPEPEVADDLLAALRAGDASRLGAALSNDLERASTRLRPGLRLLLEAGRAAGAHGALVGGSGPTTVFLCESPEHAEEVDAALQRDHGTPPALHAHGPVPGVRLTSAHLGGAR